MSDCGISVEETVITGVHHLYQDERRRERGMAIGVIFAAAGMTQAQYDQVRN
jgi:hypothetical protein